MIKRMIQIIRSFNKGQRTIFLAALMLFFGGLVSTAFIDVGFFVPPLLTGYGIGIALGMLCSIDLANIKSY